jgi:hypothetical protein
MKTQIDVRWPGIVHREQEVSGKAMGRKMKHFSVVLDPLIG